MQKFFIASLLVGLLALAPTAHAAERTVDTKITRVIVYPGSARVTRQGKEELPAGEHVLTVKGLPTSVALESLQANASGPAGAKIGAVEIGTSYASRALDAEVRSLEDKIDKKREEIAAVDDEKKSLDSQLQFVAALRDGISKKAGESIPTAPRIDVAGWKQTVAFVGQESERILAAQRKLEPRKKKLQGELSVLERELEELRAKQSTNYQDVAINVELPRPGALTLSLEYVAYGASWGARYDARLDTETQKVNLDYGASVSQATGEDWKDVQLILSTAQPSTSQTLPDLPAWYIQVRQPVVMRELRKKAKMEMMAGSMAMEQAEMDEMVAQAPVPATEAPAAYDMAEAVESGLSMEFIIAKRQSVFSNGEPKQLEIGNYSLAATLLARAVPKRDEAAFVTSEIENSTGVPLLSGAAQLFVDGAFQGNTGIGSVPPGDFFTLSLGRDPSIKILREYVVSRRQSAGLLSRKVERFFHYRIRVKNLRKAPRKIILKDQVPVSRDERITIALADGTTPSNSPEADPKYLPEALAKKALEQKEPAKPGTLSWEYDLLPGEEKTIELKFLVTHAPDLEIEGL
ncbi:MAG: mucoidy inhibitor MuiA family protein [Bdellovibrionota bacterium]